MRLEGAGGEPIPALEDPFPTSAARFQAASAALIPAPRADVPQPYSMKATRIERAVTGLLRNFRCATSWTTDPGLTARLRDLRLSPRKRRCRNLARALRPSRLGRMDGLRSRSRAPSNGVERCALVREATWPSGSGTLPVSQRGWEMGSLRSDLFVSGPFVFWTETAHFSPFIQAQCFCSAFWINLCLREKRLDFACRNFQSSRKRIA